MSDMTGMAFFSCPEGATFSVTKEVPSDDPDAPEGTTVTVWDEEASYALAQAHWATCPGVQQATALGKLTIVPLFIRGNGTDQAEIRFTTLTPIFFIIDEENVFHTEPVDRVASITLDSTIPHAMKIEVHDGVKTLATGVLMVVNP